MTTISYSKNILPRLCVWCGRFTRERVRFHHSEITSLPDADHIGWTQVAHHDCYASRNQILSEEKMKEIMKKSAAQELADPPQFPKLK